MTDLIVYRYVVNYDYDYDQVVTIMTIGSSPIVEF